MMASKFRFAAGCLLALALSACSALVSYPGRVGPARDAMAAGNLPQAMQLLQTRRFDRSGNNIKPTHDDHICYALEDGTLNQLAGQYAQSSKIFAEIEDLMKQNDQRAMISIGKTLQQISAGTINDKTIAYEGAGFERVFMHSLEALNYVMQQDTQGARVEIKKGYQAASRIREYKAREIEELDKQPKNQGFNQDQAFSSANQQLQSQAWWNDLQNAANVIHDPYQNGFAYYLSSLVYEANGDYGDAFIDCKSAYNLIPNCPAVRADVCRLADKTGMADEKQKYVQACGEPPARLEKSGDVAVVFQCGLAAQKNEFKIRVAFPVWKRGRDGAPPEIIPVMQSMAVPYYLLIPTAAAGLEVAEDGKALGRTALAVNMDALALRELRDEYPAILTRAILRVGVRVVGQVAAIEGSNNANDALLFSIAISALSDVLEQADLRAWLTRPANVQVARINLPAGNHNLSLNLLDANGAVIDRRTVAVKVEADKISFINLRGVSAVIGAPQVSAPL